MLIDKYVRGDFLSAADVKTGDRIKFLDRGEENEMKGYAGKKIVLTFKVLTEKREEKKITPNRTSLRTLAKKWGTETAEWVGKIATIQKDTDNIRGERVDVIYLLPEGETKIEKSDVAVNVEFDNLKDEDIPIIGEEEGIQVDKIPF